MSEKWVVCSFYDKVGLPEKQTKFDKIFLVVLTNQPIYLVKVKTTRKIFSNYVRFSKSPNFKQNFLLQNIFTSYKLNCTNLSKNGVMIDHFLLAPSHFLDYKPILKNNRSWLQTALLNNYHIRKANFHQLLLDTLFS